MKKTLKVTFGTMLAVSSVVPAIVTAHEHFAEHLAIWADVTYTEASNNGLSVGDLVFANTIANDFDGGHRHIFLNPDHEFDYALGISYRLPYSHSHLFMSYDHFNDDIDNEGEVNIRNLGLAPLPQTQGIASYEVHSQEFRFGVTHNLGFGDRFCLDLLAFLEYDKLRQTVSEIATQVDDGELRVHARETENKVKGFGPGVGFNSRWYAYNPHWHIFAGASTILLAADNDYSQSFLGGDNDIDFYAYQPEGSDSLVGKIDINFGINYHCAFSYAMCGYQWDLTLGMRYMNMFNVFKNGNTAFNPNAGDDNDVASDFAANLGFPQDWGRWGPFLRFKIGGAHS
ncbi:MAG: hypothetical protein JSS07_07870 [Proteobacteria bacterium]|nr:hypothetical protein [Pseudomonadota bacterium]